MKLTGTKATRSPARTALAEAIEAKAKAIRDLAAAEAAVASLDAMTRDTEAELEAMRAKLAEEAESAVHKAIHGGVLEDVSTAAHARQAALSHRLAAMHAAKPSCLEGQKNAAKDADKAASAIDEAVQAVGHEAVPALLKEAQAMQRELFRRRQVLLYLTGNYPNIGNYTFGFEPSADLAALQDFLSDAQLPRQGIYLHTAVKYGDHCRNAEAPWQAAREALTSDPDAELPA